MHDLLQKYRKEIAPARCRRSLEFENIMAVPRIKKVIINSGIGKVSKEDKVVERRVKDLTSLSGQKPVFKKAKKSISGFKSRQGMNIAMMITLRGKRMYDFIDRLTSIALPRSKDFRGIDTKNFDHAGNLNFGIRESSIFPELNYENVKDIFGLEVTISTDSKNREQGIELMRLMGFPIKK